MNCKTLTLLLSTCLVAAAVAADGPAAEPAKRIRAGIIGLDTSHVVEFTKLLEQSQGHRRAGRDVDRGRLSRRQPGLARQLEPRQGVHREAARDGRRDRRLDRRVVAKVDAVLLESVDGRPHLAQARPVIAAGKPLFIDKPMAASLADAMEIFRLAKAEERALLLGLVAAVQLGLSGGPQRQAVRRGPQLHGVAPAEHRAAPPRPVLVRHPRRGDPLYDHGAGLQDGHPRRPGEGGRRVEGRPPRHVHRHKKYDYGAAVEGDKGSGDAGKYDGYTPLVVEIVKFFKTGKPPVSAEETLEILAFMEAADESKRQAARR